MYSILGISCTKINFKNDFNNILTVETYVFNTTPPSDANFPVKINSIDTVSFFGANKKLYYFSTFDRVLEGYGSIVHPLAPLINLGFFGFCNCGINFEFFDGNDTTAYYFNQPGCEDPLAKINYFEQKGQFKVYPNPTSGSTVFSIDKEGEIDFHIIITDINGKVIKEFDIKTEELEKNLDFLENGIYLVHLIRHGETKSIKKLVYSN